MIRTENLNFNNNDFKLNGLNLSISENKFTSILGPNGAGKSTLLKILSGNIEEYQGKVLIEEKNLKEIPLKELAKKRAVLSQNLEVTFPFMAKEIVAMGRSPHTKGFETEEDKRIIDFCLSQVGMLAFKNRQFNSLSGGEKQRVQLARVLAQLEYGKPSSSHKYLFLDEPTSALDLKHQSEVLKLLKKLISEHNLTIIAILHDLNLAAKFSDNVILLKDGRLVEDGETSEVLNKQNLKTLYEVDVEIITSNNKNFYMVS